MIIKKIVFHLFTLLILFISGHQSILSHSNHNSDRHSDKNLATNSLISEVLITSPSSSPLNQNASLTAIEIEEEEDEKHKFKKKTFRSSFAYSSILSSTSSSCILTGFIKAWFSQSHTRILSSNRNLLFEVFII